MVNKITMIFTIATTACAIRGQSFAFTSFFGSRYHRWQRGRFLSADSFTSTTVSPLNEGSSRNSAFPNNFLIYWRGEHKEGYSQTFRHWEFLSALTATIADRNHTLNASKIYQNLVETACFSNAFSFDPTKRLGLGLMTSFHQAELYNKALQFLSFSSDSCRMQSMITPEVVAHATKRCALIHSSYQVVADGMEYSELVDRSFESRAFEDMFSTYPHNNIATASRNSNNISKSWSVRRQEHSFANDNDQPRFGKRTTRSPSKEKAALLALKPLLEKFGGKVDLKNPECQLYLMEGLCDDDSSPKEEKLYKVLSIQLASGAKHSVMAPKTRTYKTNTPLCSISAHLLCNIAMIRGDQTVLDPFAGSAATLLAASLIASGVRTVGIEVLSDQFLPRKRIRQDFISRELKEPLAVLEGNVMDLKVRDESRNLIGNTGFDIILTDPPYGIRETLASDGSFDGKSALSNLIKAIGHDLSAGKPLLKPGGRVVAFQPCRQGQNIRQLLPSPLALEQAGLRLEDMREQKLNSGLSRWVVSFLSI
ncbi:hypothetical protein ACHAW6_015313 [Cyclotella cf. meneghiniana]